jgi:AraC family cel operon transcriptional repressor
MVEIFRLTAEGYIDTTSEFEFKQIMNYRDTYPLVHDHDYFEVFLIVEGEVNHFINGEIIPLKKGHLVFIRPEDYHKFYYVAGDCALINLAILNKTITDLFAYLGSGFNRQQFLEPAMPPTFLLSKHELTDLLSKFEILNTIPVNDKLRLNLEMRCIITNLFSRFFVNRHEPDTGLPDWLTDLVEELQKPAHFKAGVQVIKKLAFKSEEHICRSFKKYLNTTPTQYVNVLKLNYAANQIRFTNKLVVDIAFESGFENLSNFHRQFKKLYNVTPAEFRKVNQKDNKYQH